MICICHQWYILHKSPGTAAFHNQSFIDKKIHCLLDCDTANPIGFTHFCFKWQLVVRFVDSVFYFSFMSFAIRSYFVNLLFPPFKYTRAYFCFYYTRFVIRGQNILQMPKAPIYLLLLIRIFCNVIDCFWIDFPSSIFLE